MPMNIMRLAIILIFVFAVAPRPSLSQESAAPPAGFEALFNGVDLDGWVALKTYDPRAFAALSDSERSSKIEDAKKSTGEFWRVEGGEIINDGQGPYLTTEREFRDFELLIEYRTVAKADSGIYLKATPQVQIWDSTLEKNFKIGADKGSGGLWNNSKGAAGKDPLELADNAFGEWNRFRIRQVGSRTDVWLNDKHIVQNAIMENYWDKSRKTPLSVSGPIQLQTHGGEIRWRNIFVREIPVDEASQILAAPGDEDFTKLFDGTSLAGWQGSIDEYEVRDGSIQCKPGKSGNLYTKDQYADFVARLEFRLPPGGNNGLAIRYPGQGDPYVAGMCELQVLDNTASKYETLDSRQYHGSAYGMVAAHRSYLRPVGQWNYQEVTVKGTQVKVELNGTVILDCDLTEASDFMDGVDHPEINRASGHFGFVGHGDPVQFRNIRIKKLESNGE